MSCFVSFHYRFYGTFRLHKVYRALSTTKVTGIGFVKEVYKSDKRKSQHIMLTFFLAYKVLDKWISFDKVLR